MQEKNGRPPSKKLKIRLAFLPVMLYNISMNTFRYKYGKLVSGLLIAVLPITAAGLIWNIYNIVALYETGGTFRLITYGITAAVMLMLLVFEAAALFRAKYTVKEGFLTCTIGFVHSKRKVKDVAAVTVKDKKLAVIFSGGEYSVIVIDEDKYADFIGALENENPDIIVENDTGF